MLCVQAVEAASAEVAVQQAAYLPQAQLSAALEQLASAAEADRAAAAAFAGGEMHFISVCMLDVVVLVLEQLAINAAASAVGMISAHNQA